MKISTTKTKNRPYGVDTDRKEKRQVLQILNSGKAHGNKRITKPWAR